jgi:hypothetical protein
MHEQDSTPSKKIPLPLFPEDPRWPDEWVKLVFSSESNNHFHIDHLEACFKQEKILTRIVRKKPTLSLWVPSWRHEFAFELARKIMVDDRGAAPVTIIPPDLAKSEQPIDPAELVDQIMSEVEELPEGEKNINLESLPLRHAPRSWPERALILGESVCAVLLWGLAACAVVILLSGLAEEADKSRYIQDKIDEAVQGMESLDLFAMTAAAIAFRSLRVKRRKLEQIVRNNWARNLLSPVLLDEACPRFTFFLRPFQADYRFVEGQDVHHSLLKPFISAFQSFTPVRIFMPRYFFPERSANVELLFASVLWPSQPLIAIGKVDERPGAGLVELKDDEWKKAFAKLAFRATTILVLPGTSRGALFEIAWMQRRSCFGKVLLFKPRHKSKYEHWWSEVTRGYSELGIFLPALNSRAGLLGIGDGLVREAPMSKVSRRQIRKALDAFAFDRARSFRNG